MNDTNSSPELTPWVKDPEAQRRTDDEHLKLLAAFHWVMGFLVLGCLLFLGFHYFMFSSFFEPGLMAQFEAAEQRSEQIDLADDDEFSDPAIEEAATKTTDIGGEAPISSDPFPDEFFGFLKVFYVLGALAIIAAAVVHFLSAVWIKKRKNRVFSIVVAAISLANTPFGTALGVCTLIVLLRESVKWQYDQKASSGQL